MTGTKKRDRSERPTVGKIKCPAGHPALVKRQAAGRKLYYIHCGKCGGITASGQGWQDYILENSRFNGAPGGSEKTTSKPDVEVITDDDPAPATKKSFFTHDDDLEI